MDHTTLYAGLTGVTLQPERYDLGHGVVLERTYAHVMAPFVMAFLPAPPGQPHPAPWKSAGGGIYYDVHVQLTVPENPPPGVDLDQSGVVWLISALLTLAATPRVSVPILSDMPFAAVPKSSIDPVLRPMEFGDSPLIPELDAPNSLNLESLNWVRDHWIAAAQLACRYRDFDTAFQGFYYATRTPRVPLALLSLWGILEELFSPSRSELRFRVSALIATYLAPAGEERLALHRTITKLYDARSKAAHGIGSDDWGALIGTYTLIRMVLRKMIHNQHVPTKEELELNLFGGHP